MSNGKGSTPRPLGVDRQTYEANWYRIFEAPNANASDTFTETRLVCDVNHETGEVSGWRKATITFRVERA